MKQILTAIALLASMSAAHADFERWSTEVADDPFNGGQNVTASYMDSLRSGVFIECNSSAGTIVFKVIAGWAYVADLAGFTPIVKYAVDGVVIDVAGVARAGAFGDNIAGIHVDLEPNEARKLVEAFVGAKKQIAIQDGISDQPHLLTARGSTSSGEKLLACINKVGQ
jgi:hypothetical protein